MALEVAKNGRFRFFDLPPELRDMVYDNLKERKFLEVESVESSESFSCTVEHLHPNFQLVNRQFKKEAEAQIGKSITLSVMPPLGDLFVDTWDPDQGFSKWTKNPTSLETTLDVYCGNSEVYCESDCLASDDIRQHMRWIMRLVERFSSLRSTHMEILVEWPAYAYDCWPSSQHGPKFQKALDELIAIPTVVELTVIASDFNNRSDQLEPSRGLWAKWERNTGWQVPENAKLGPPMENRYREDEPVESDADEQVWEDEEDDESGEDQDEGEGEELDENDIDEEEAE